MGALPRPPWPHQRIVRASGRGVGAHVDGGPYDAGRGCHAWCDGRGGGSLGRTHAAVVRAFPFHYLCARTDPPQIDSLVPAYACPAADEVRDAFEAVPAWTAHLSENAPLKARLDAVFGTAGLDAWASWCL